MDLRFTENGLHFWLHVTKENDALLLALGQARNELPQEAELFRPVQMECSGDNTTSRGSKMAALQPGHDWKYVCSSDIHNRFGRKIEIVQQKESLFLTSHYQFYHGVSAVRCWTEIQNSGEPLTLEYLSSCALTGLLQQANARDVTARVHIPHNTWYGEAQWTCHSLAGLGYAPVLNRASTKRISLHTTGSWACSDYLPMGAFEDAEGRHTLLWQIENSSSWHWELSDAGQQMYLLLSGPNWQENGWSILLNTGETFTTVPCAIVYAEDGFEAAVQQMTRYRRLIRRPNADNEHPSVIFNDYMNCLMGDPTTAKELPMIKAAAEAGCKYYCVDAGWYSDGPWWDGVGEWLPSKARFPGGLMEVLDAIRAHGMIPGLWLELEVMGIKCPLADQLPDSWFFQRRGKRIIRRSRYQLDYANPEVRAYAHGIIKRLVEEYGVGYIKMDYNINAGVGTDRDCLTSGEGLLRHTRAYQAWLDEVFIRYPDLVIENCSSGGMRMEYSQLSRHSIQSVTDQTDYRLMAAIACNCPTAVTPEQAAIWSYPLRDGDAEETCFNMINAMLLRIHQSGHLAEMDEARKALVHEAIRIHLDLVDELKEGVPFWPLGLATFQRKSFALGIDCGEHSYIAVWNVSDAPESIALPLQKAEKAELLYPTTLPRSWSQDDHFVRITLQGRTASLFRFS